MVPYNLLSVNGKAAYTNTGTWASGAIKEAKMVGNVDVVASSKESNYNYIRKIYSRFGIRLFPLYFQQYDFWDANEIFPESRYADGL
jgi:hypothetical protein